MVDYIKRLLIAAIMMAGISVLMVGVKGVQAEEPENWVWPLKEEVTITSSFGDRGGQHNGLDIAASVGTSVAAVNKGIVKKSYYSASYGNVIFILHNNGYETVYAHLSSRLVEKGEKVKEGQVIGEVGNTGHSTGSHLHFEVHNGLWNIDKTNAIDPLLVIDDRNPGQKVNTVSRHPHKKLFIHGHVGGQTGELQEIQDASETKKKTVTIEKGDTLWDLAHEYNVPVASLKQWNDLSTDVLVIGDELTIYPELFETYEVSQGDTLDLISEKTGVSKQSLIEHNNLQEDKLFPEQILITGTNL